MQYGARLLVNTKFDDGDTYLSVKKGLLFNYLAEELKRTMKREVTQSDESDGHTLIEIRLEIVTSAEFVKFLKAIKALDLPEVYHQAVTNEICKTFKSQASGE